MEAQSEKFNRSTLNRPEGARLLDAPLVQISLPDFVRRLRDESAWEKSDRNAITVLHSSFMRIVMVALKAHAELDVHATEAAISIHVLNGRLSLETPAESCSIDEQQMVALRPGVQHYVYAEEESVFILTLAGDHQGEF